MPDKSQWSFTVAPQKKTASLVGCVWGFIVPVFLPHLSVSRGG